MKNAGAFISTQKRMEKDQIMQQRETEANQM